MRSGLGIRHSALALVLFATTLGAQATNAPAKAATHKSSAQAPLDRSVVPTAGKQPELKVPSWTKTKLSNGADFVVSVKKGLPLDPLGSFQ